MAKEKYLFNRFLVHVDECTELRAYVVFLVNPTKKWVGMQGVTMNG